MFKLIVRDASGERENVQVGDFDSYAEALKHAQTYWYDRMWYIQGPPAKPLQDQLQHKIDQLYLR